MADVQANITLVTTGGTESAAEINKATSAIGGMTTASSGMETQFQHRFQHIGLMLFAGDALRASGLGSETRLVIGALNTALIAGASSAGIAAGGFLLIVTAMAALVGIGAKVLQHHKDEIDALNKNIAANEQLGKSYDDEINGIEGFIQAGGRATPVMKELLDADKAIASDIADNQLVNYQKLILALNLKIAAEKDSAMAEVALVAVVDKVTAAHVSLLTTLASVGLWLQGKHFGESAEDVAKHQQAIDADTASLHKAEQAMQDLVDGTRADWKQMADDERKAQDDMLANVSAGAQLEQQYYDNLYKAIEKDKDDQVKEHEKQLQKEGQTVQKYVGQFAGDFGTAFAKMIVEGQDFGTAMETAFKNLAEQIIEDIVKIEVEWMVLTSLGFPASGGAGMFGGFGGGFATGGSAVVDKPTLFMAGEAGPEMATFSPMGASGTASGDAGGGGGVQIGTVQTNVYGVTDPSRIADQVGDQIIQRIRGMGEINFTR